MATELIKQFRTLNIKHERLNKKVKEKVTTTVIEIIHNVVKILSDNLNT